MAERNDELERRVLSLELALAELRKLSFEHSKASIGNYSFVLDELIELEGFKIKTLQSFGFISSRIARLESRFPDSEFPEGVE